MQAAQAWQAESMRRHPAGSERWQRYGFSSLQVGQHARTTAAGRTLASQLPGAAWLRAQADACQAARQAQRRFATTCAELVKTQWSSGCIKTYLRMLKVSIAKRSVNLTPSSIGDLIP